MTPFTFFFTATSCSALTSSEVEFIFCGDSPVLKYCSKLPSWSVTEFSVLKMDVIETLPLVISDFTSVLEKTLT